MIIVPVIAFLTASPHHAVAAGGNGTVVQTIVLIDPVTVVASLKAGFIGLPVDPEGPVTADSDRTMAPTPVSVLLITVIARFTRIESTVTTKLSLTTWIAAIAHFVVAIVTGFKARILGV